MASDFEWTRKVQIQNDQARITLPKRWIDNMEIEDSQELAVKLGDNGRNS